MLAQNTQVLRDLPGNSVIISNVFFTKVFPNNISNYIGKFIIEPAIGKYDDIRIYRKLVAILF